MASKIKERLSKDAQIAFGMLAIVLQFGWNRVNLKPVSIKKNKVTNFPSNDLDDEKYSVSSIE